MHRRVSKFFLWRLVAPQRHKTIDLLSIFNVEGGVMGPENANATLASPQLIGPRSLHTGPDRGPLPVVSQASWDLPGRPDGILHVKI